MTPAEHEEMLRALGEGPPIPELDWGRLKFRLPMDESVMQDMEDVPVDKGLTKAGTHDNGRRDGTGSGKDGADPKRKFDTDQLHRKLEMQRELLEAAVKKQKIAEKGLAQESAARQRAEKKQKTAERGLQKAEERCATVQKHADKEVSRLKKELQEQQKSAMRVAAAPGPRAPAQRPCAKAMEELVNHLFDELKKMHGAAAAAHATAVAQAAAAAAAAAAPAAAAPAAAAPAAAAPAAAATGVKWIKQINTSYNTAREIQYHLSTKKFMFNSGKSSTNHGTADAWVDITDAPTITLLEQLGTWSAKQRRFNPVIGRKVSYSHGSHTYDVEVVKEWYPWSSQGIHAAAAAAAAPAAAPAAAAPAAAAPAAPPNYGPGSIGFKMTLDNTTAAIDLPPAVVQGWLDAMRTDPHHDNYKLMAVSAAQKKFLELGELWSSFSQGFQYSQTSTLWIKPSWFKTWCSIYLSRKFTSIRIVAHGMNPAKAELFFKDPIGPITGMSSHSNRYDVGHYVTTADGVAADYSRHGGAPDNGSLILEVIMERSSDPAIRTGSLWKEYNIGTCNRANYHGSLGGMDARNVYDTSIVLPLGYLIGR